MKKGMTVTIEGIVIEFDKMEVDNGRIYTWRNGMILFSFNPYRHKLVYMGQHNMIHYELIKL